MDRSSPILLLLLLASAFCFASCDTPVPRQTPFNEADFVKYRGPGTATVTGKLVVSTEDGTKEGNGASVELVPVNDYTVEMIEMELGHGQLLSPRADPRFKKYARIVTTDEHGNFSIPAVPAGHYLICGEVDWLPGYATDYKAQWALERITVASGERVHVTLTHNPSGGRRIEMIQLLR
jgi:hypothetical protein